MREMALWRTRDVQILVIRRMSDVYDKVKSVLYSMKMQRVAGGQNLGPDNVFREMLINCAARHSASQLRLPRDP